MIVFENVTKVYKTSDKRKVILDNVSFALPRGVNLGIIGSNGSGKSTIIRLIAGVELPDSGTIRRGCNVSFPLGFSGTFAGSMSGRENAIFLARVYGADVRYVLQYAQEFAELGDYFDMPVQTYSSGMRARLAFGVSIAIDFDVYLVDEVTAVGDARFQERSKAALLSRFSTSDVIMVSHSTEVIKEYCKYVAVLDKGHMTFHDDLDEANRAHRANMGLAPL